MKHHLGRPLILLAALAAAAGCSGREETAVAARDRGPDTASLAPVGDSGTAGEVERKTQSGARTGSLPPGRPTPGHPRPAEDRSAGRDAARGERPGTTAPRNRSVRRSATRTHPATAHSGGMEPALADTARGLPAAKDSVSVHSAAETDSVSAPATPPGRDTASAAATRPSMDSADAPATPPGTDSAGAPATPPSEADTSSRGYRASNDISRSAAQADSAGGARDTVTADSSPTVVVPPSPPARPGPPPARPASTPPAAAATAAAATAASALPAGTEIRAALQDSISSLRNSVGQSVTALIVGDLRAPDGVTVLPSGAPLRLTIERLRPAPNRSAKDGELVLRADSVSVGGTAYRLQAVVRPIPHELRGRGVTAGEAEKVGAGAAAGAVIGGVVTGKTKGAVIGGVVGAAGGAVVAAQTASRDVIVTPKTTLTLILRAPVTRAGR